jgi:hypothetical protein
MVRLIHTPKSSSLFPAEFLKRPTPLGRSGYNPQSDDLILDLETVCYAGQKNVRLRDLRKRGAEFSVFHPVRPGQL